MRPRDVYPCSKAEAVEILRGMGYRVVGFRVPMFEDMYASSPDFRFIWHVHLQDEAIAIGVRDISYGSILGFHVYPTCSPRLIVRPL